jgi:hypothetical protein
MTALMTDSSQQYIKPFVIAFAAFMVSLDSIIFNIYLKVIPDFHVEFGLVSSVVVGYLLVDAGFFLVFGKIGEIPGLMVGVVLFCTLVVKVIPGRIPDAVAATAKISLRISSYPGSLPPLLCCIILSIATVRY